MRTTINFSDDAVAGVEKLRRERGLGFSEAVNYLVRSGLHAEFSTYTFRQKTHDLGSGVDFSNIGETIETLDGPTAH